MRVVPGDHGHPRQPGTELTHPDQALGLQPWIRPAPAGRGSESFSDPLELATLAGAARRWWLLVLGGFLGVAAGWGAYRLSPSVYRATSSIRLTSTRHALAGALASDERDPDAGPDVSPLLSKLEVLHSRNVAERAADGPGGGVLRATVRGIARSAVDGPTIAPRVDTATVALTFGPQWVEATAGGARAQGPYGTPIEVGGVRFTVPARPDSARAWIHVGRRDAAVERVMAGLVAKPRSGTDVVDVSLISADPRTARQSLDAVITAYRDVMLEDARARLRGRVAFVEQQLRRTDSALAAAQGALSAFRSRRRGAPTHDDIALLHGGLVTVEMRRRDLAGEQRLVDEMLTRMAAAPGPRDEDLRALAVAMSTGTAAEPVFDDVYRQLVRLQAGRDSLTRGPTGRAVTHPDVLRADALIVATRQRLVDLARARSAGLAVRIAELDRLASGSAATLRALPRLEEQETQLVTRAEQMARLSDQLRAEYQRALIAESAEWGSVDVIDRADLGSRIGVNARQSLAFGGVLGTLAGLLGAVVLEVLDGSIRRREQVSQRLGLPELAVIPRAGAPRRPWSWRVTPGRSAESAARAAWLVDLRSAEAEAYRMLRTNVLYAAQGEARRVIGVTSPLPRDGKTTVSCNLAAALASPHRRVLLVDADTRQPAAHRVFGVSREPGLVDALAGRMPLHLLVRPTPVPGLDILPAGMMAGAGHDLVQGDAMASIFAEAAASYALVVVDTPPTLLTADAAVLAPLCDGVVVVVRAGHTALAAGQQAVSQLAAVNARVLGAVLNDPNNKLLGRGGYGMYYGARYGASTADPGALKAGAVASDVTHVPAADAVAATGGFGGGGGASVEVQSERHTRAGRFPAFTPAVAPVRSAPRIRPGRAFAETVEFLYGHLEVVGGPGVGRDVRFVRLPGEHSVEVTFGRSQGAAHRHVHLAAETASRQHAVMTLADGRWRLRNLSTTNPVALNGRVLAPGELSPDLSEGDRIEMGEVAFQFHAR